MTGQIYIYRLLTNRMNAKGQKIFINFGCRFPTIEALVDELNKGKAVYGFNLRTEWARDDEGECLKVIAKEPYGVTPAGIAAVELPCHRYVEFSAP